MMMDIPTREELAAAIEADRETGMPIDWSTQKYSPTAIYWHIYYREGGRFAGTYATQHAAELAVAEMVYGQGDNLEYRYRAEPGGTLSRLKLDYARNVPSFVAEYEVKLCQPCMHTSGVDQ